jgi:3-oxoacyl-[acyl-carrier protein] reductase
MASRSTSCFRAGSSPPAASPGAGRSPEADKALQEQLAPLAAAIPLGRFGEPIELGNVVAFLASQQASYVTGAVYQVDGGSIKSNV